MSMLNRFWLIQRRSGVPVKSSLTDIQGDSKWQNSIDRTRLPILVCQCRYSSIYHFRDTKIRLIGRKSASFAVFTGPSLFWSPVKGVHLGPWIWKLVALCYSSVETARSNEHLCSRGTGLWRTDGQTDGQMAPRMLRAF